MLWFRSDDTGAYLSIVSFRCHENREGKMVFKSVICIGVVEGFHVLLRRRVGVGVVLHRAWGGCVPEWPLKSLYEYRCISSLHPDCIIFI